MAEPDRNDGMKPWGYRRKVITTTLIYCALMLSVITGWQLINPEADVPLLGTIVTGCFGLMGAVIGYYVGGAVFADIKLGK